MIITSYIGVWGWHLVAMMFFLAGTFMYLKSVPYGIAFFAAFAVAEFISFRRKAEFYEEIS